jgi:hypothetical protein
VLRLPADFCRYANSTGRTFNLIARVTSVLSARLHSMEDAGVINLDPMLPAR